MASDNEDDPSRKRMKLDTSADTDARSINSLFPKIDNLEHFPLKVLLHIFEYVDDIALLNLATESYRLEGIAKMVLNVKYTKKYFVVKETDDDEMIFDFFDQFGKEIRAIKAEVTEMDDEDHWISSVLDKASNLRKLALDISGIDTTHERFLQQHVNVNITHLTIDMHTCGNKCTQFVAPDFRNLKQLAVGSYPVFSLESFKELMRNNPGLEMLRIGEENRYCCNQWTTEAYPFVELMDHIGACSMQLKDFSYINDNVVSSYDAAISSVPDHIIEHFVNALQHLESLSLAIDLFDDTAVLLRRLGLGCSRINQLELFCDFDYIGDAIFEAIKSFRSLGSLKLFHSENLFLCQIESLVERLPLLNGLQFDVEHGVDASFLLILLQKCPSLKKIMIRITSIDYDLKSLDSNQSTDAFIKIVQNRNVEIEIKDDDSTICYLSNQGIIWHKDMVAQIDS